CATALSGVQHSPLPKKRSRTCCFSSAEYLHVPVSNGTSPTRAEGVFLPALVTSSAASISRRSGCRKIRTFARSPCPTGDKVRGGGGFPWRARHPTGSPHRAETRCGG